MKFRFLILYIITAVALLGMVSTSRIYAATSSSISINTIPENPSPNENVTVTLNSYAENLDSVLITWYVSGKNVLSGIGKKSLSLKAPTAEETTVIAHIALPAGQVEATVIIRPSIVVLLWQANDSYVPPFYKGKALPTPDSEVEIVALPEIKSEGVLVNPKNMIYAWRKDYTNDQEASGYGKNSFTYISDYLEDSNYIEVTASTTNQQYSSQANININTIQPKISFYKNDVNLGTVWEHALTDPHKIESSEIVLAAPYFISPKDIRNPRLIWSWFINDQAMFAQSLKNNLMPLQAESGVSGVSKLKLEIENMDKIFETAEKEINIEF